MTPSIAPRPMPLANEPRRRRHIGREPDDEADPRQDERAAADDAVLGHELQIIVVGEGQPEPVVELLVHGVRVDVGALPGPGPGIIADHLDGILVERPAAVGRNVGLREAPDDRADPDPNGRGQDDDDDETEHPPETAPRIAPRTSPLSVRVGELAPRRGRRGGQDGRDGQDHDARPRLGEDEADADEDRDEAQQERPLEALLAEPEDPPPQRQPLLHGEVAGFDQEIAQAQRKGHLQEAGEMVAVDERPGDGAEAVALGPAEDHLVAAERLGHAVEGLEKGRGEDDDDQDLGPAPGADGAQDEVAEEPVAEDENELRDGRPRRQGQRERGRGGEDGVADESRVDRIGPGREDLDEGGRERDDLEDGEARKTPMSHLKERRRRGSYRARPPGARRLSVGTSGRRHRAGKARSSPPRRRKRPTPRPSRWAGEGR